MDIIPTLGKHGQEDHKFRASLNYTVRSYIKNEGDRRGEKREGRKKG